LDPETCEDPPPRAAWEQPPRDGWGSTLLGLALELLQFLLTLAAGTLVMRAIEISRRLSERGSGTRLLNLVLLFVVALMLAAAIGAYIWNRASGIATLFAMLTDYGRTARFGGRPPVFLDTAPARGLKIAHLTDLHVTEGPRVRLIEKPRPGGNEILPLLFTRPELAESDLILFSGDLTDRGTAASWHQVRGAIKKFGLAEKAILVPGNHDIALVEYIRRTEALRSDRFGVVQLANLLKFAEAFAETHGGTHGVVWDGGARLPYLDAFRRIEAIARPLLEELPSIPVPRLRARRYREEIGPFRAYRTRIEDARKGLLQLFPVAVPLPVHDAELYVVNSSARIFRHPTMNAFGHVGHSQYQRLHRLAESSEAHMRLVAVHHHIVRRSEERSLLLKRRFFASFTVLGDARPLAKFCEKHRVRAIMNGHRHVSYQLRLANGTVLLAAPSSTMGDELARDPRPQFERYDFAETVVAPSVGVYRRSVRLGMPAEDWSSQLHPALPPAK
jgi:3',5'-cyclic AMP phosphodiesterase CpdA